MMQRIYTFLLIALAAITFGSCNKPSDAVFQKQVAIPSAAWDYKFQPEFTFEIPDTISRYKVYLIFRYDAAFEFSNIWLRLKTKAPSDSTFSKGNRIETVLIAQDGSRLGNDIGGMYEYKIQLREGADYYKFSKPGKYQIKMEQIMRKNPLVGLLNIGLRVERLDAKKPVG